MTDNESLRFLQFLFSGKDDNQYILIWTAPDKASRFFQNLEEATSYISEIGSNQHIYFGVGTHFSPSTKGRGLITDIASIPALWIDIDITDVSHQKKNLPPSIDDALEILDGLPWTPSIIVDTGHGCHSYYLFREPLAITSDTERVAVSLLIQKFQSYIREIFKKKGWTIDSTHDLARVMRVPGTTNIKVPGKYVQARILTIDDWKSYNVSDFDSLPDLPDNPKSENESNVTVSMDGLLLDPQANPPIDKLEATIEVDVKFEQSWQHKRKDFSSGDYSQSSYDMSLASIACINGWSDQEIIDLVIANRRKFNSPPKIRVDYFRGLLLNAKKAAAKIKAHAAIEKDILFRDQVSSTDDPELSSESRESMWEHYSNLWNFKIYRVVRTVGDPVVFRMETEHGRINIGPATNIISQTQFRGLVADRTKVLISREKAGAWDKISHNLIASAVDEDFGSEATDQGLITSLITQYINKQGTARQDNSENYRNALLSRQPFMRGNCVTFFLDQFQNWVVATSRETVRRTRLIQLLGMINCRTSQVHVPKTYGSQETTTNSVWVLPENFSLGEPSKDTTAEIANSDISDVDPNNELDFTPV
jgi:hypothetical protein